MPKMTEFMSKNEHCEKVLERPSTPSMVEHCHKVLKRMFQFAIENELVITINPISLGLTKRVKSASSASRLEQAPKPEFSLEMMDYVMTEFGGQPYEEQVKDYSIVSGTPKTVIPKIRHIMEYLRPGSIFFWDGDGAMTHEDQMRSLRLMGEEVIPAVREIAKELDLPGPFEVDPATGKPIDGNPTAAAPAETAAS